MRGEHGDAQRAAGRGAAVAGDVRHAMTGGQVGFQAEIRFLAEKAGLAGRCGYGILRADE